MTSLIEKLLLQSENLALHSWIPQNPRGALFYIHGIQSHGGWLFETGPALAAHGIATYILDRRGCGLSEGRRGHVDTYRTWIDDYTSAINTVRNRHQDLPFTVLGQSMGGSILSGVLSLGQATYDSVVFCAPAINQGANLSEEKIRALNKEQVQLAKNPDYGLNSYVVPFKDEWYTTDPGFLSFMKKDRLMAREITVQGHLARADLQKFYMTNRSRWTARPTVFIQPRRDAIINLEIAKRTLQEFMSGDLLCLEVPVDDHYIEFSTYRHRYLKFLSEFVVANGF